MNTAKYQIVNGTFYSSLTSTEVICVLEKARQDNRRLKIYLGNPLTGEDWTEENDTEGYISRSTGEHKIPLLVKTSRSFGGGALLDHCIVKIKESKGKQVLYKCPNYVAPIMHIEQSGPDANPWELYVNGKVYSRHKTEQSANRLKNKLS